MSEPRKCRVSIPSTYDSRETGPRFHVTTGAGGRVVKFRAPIDDPFVNHEVRLGWLDLLRGLVRGHLTVNVVIGADVDLMNDVLELDENTLLARSTRRDEFNSQIRAKLDGLP